MSRRDRVARIWLPNGSMVGLRQDLRGALRLLLRSPGFAAVVGQTVQIYGAPFTVVGVLAEDLELPESFDAWRPLSFPADQITSTTRSARFLRVIGRLARGSTLADARAELALVSARLRSEFPAVYPADSGFQMALVSLLDQMVGGVR